jgi:hypothetical protein
VSAIVSELVEETDIDRGGDDRGVAARHQCVLLCADRADLSRRLLRLTLRRPVDWPAVLRALKDPTGEEIGVLPAYPDDLPTPRSTLRSRYARVLVWCKACRHQVDADLQALVDADRGDVPLIELRFRCSNCGGRLTDWVVTAQATGPRGTRGQVRAT